MLVLLFTLMANAQESKPLRMHFNGAFVFPVVTIKNKKFVIVGREAGGRDKRSYCIPGGGNSTWFGRETNPLTTASKELHEELILPWSTQQAYACVQAHEKSMKVQTLHKKTIVSYEIPLTKEVVDTILDGYYKRRDSYPVWAFAYREMDRIGLVKLEDLKKAVRHSKASTNVQVRACIRDPKTGNQQMITVRLRPLLVHLIRERYL
jgi:hypothetical protein